jgi:branched-chain amino acid transport system substrate-binding protein
VAPLIAYHDADARRVRYLGTALWEEPGIGREPTLVGGWFAAPEPSRRLDFERRYNATYGEIPPRLATLAYDATALAAQIAKPEAGVELLGTSGGFEGLDGLFRFRPDGSAERALAVIEVTRSGFRVVDPALTRFEDLMN